MKKLAEEVEVKKAFSAERVESSTSTSTAEVNTIHEDSFEEDDSFW